MRPLLNVTEQSVVASSLPQMQTKGPQGFDLRGASWAFVGSDSGFRGERLEFWWEAIRAFVGSDSGFRGERFALSWEGIRAIVENHSCFRGSDLALGREGDSGFRGGRIHEFNRASLRQQSQLEVIGSTKAKIYCKKKH